MRRILSQLIAALVIVVGATSIAAGQSVQGTGVGSTLRVTVLDQTDAALVIAKVTDARATTGERTTGESYRQFRPS